MATWNNDGYVSVNVSPRHFRSADFAERLLGLLEGSNVDPARLRIEITEVALFDDAPRALRTLSDLRATACSPCSTTSAPASRRCPTCTTSRSNA
jgi:EAL domain-containing protein (putative c-di-GMP-specific phosphodiesterase class I)